MKLTIHKFSLNISKMFGLANRHIN